MLSENGLLQRSMKSSRANLMSLDEVIGVMDDGELAELLHMVADEVQMRFMREGDFDTAQYRK